MIPDIIAIDWYFLICFLIVFGNVMEYCFINHMLTTLDQRSGKIDRRKKLRAQNKGDVSSGPEDQLRRRVPAVIKRKGKKQRLQRKAREGELRGHFSTVDPYHRGMSAAAISRRCCTT